MTKIRQQYLTIKYFMIFTTDTAKRLLKLFHYFLKKNLKVMDFLLFHLLNPFSPVLLLSFYFGLSLLFHSNYHDEIDKTQDLMLFSSIFTGAQLNVTYGVGFNFNTLKEGLQRNFLDGKVKCKNVPNGYTTLTQS